MQEIIGASTQPGVIQTPSELIAAVQLVLVVQDGPNIQKMEFRLSAKGLDGLIRSLQSAKDQLANIQRTPDQKQ